MTKRSERILKAILESGLSYGELSRATGIPKSALQRYATGETEKVPIDRLEAIAKATGVGSSYLIGWDSENPKEEEIPADIVELAEAAKKLSPEHRRKLLDVAKVMFGDEIEK